LALPGGHIIVFTGLLDKVTSKADEFALDTLNCAYGHVTGATDFFEKIPREQDPGRFGHYFFLTLKTTRESPISKI
jgi:hypothetical protein